MVMKAEGISFSYQSGSPPVLRELSATLRPSCVTAIIGPNGAGKSTLLRVLAGLLPPDSGRILLNERDLELIAAPERAQYIAYVSQRPRVDAPFLVRDVIEMGRFRVGRSNHTIATVLDECDLAELAETPFHHLSVGQQQRVALARALAQLQTDSPPQVARILLLDEPMSAMDPRHARSTAALLHTRARLSGLAILVVLHDLVMAARLADEVWVLRNGRLVATGDRDTTLTTDLLERVFDVPFVMVGDDRGITIPISPRE